MLGNGVTDAGTRRAQRAGGDARKRYGADSAAAGIAPVRPVAGRSEGVGDRRRIAESVDGAGARRRRGQTAGACGTGQGFAGTAWPARRGTLLAGRTPAPALFHRLMPSPGHPRRSWRFCAVSDVGAWQEMVTSKDKNSKWRPGRCLKHTLLFLGPETCFADTYARGFTLTAWRPLSGSGALPASTPDPDVHHARLAWRSRPPRSPQG